MRIIKAGHIFSLKNVDHPDSQLLTFINKGNNEDSPGTNNQEVIRALISRVKFLDDQLPFSYTIEKGSGYGERDYSVIPLSDFNSLKGTILNNENIEIDPVKQEDGNIYVLLHLLGDSDRNATDKLQKHLEKYSLEVKKINWFYVKFCDNILYKEVKYTTNQL